MSLTVKDQNVLRPPRRISSLKSPPLRIAKTRITPTTITAAGTYNRKSLQSHDSKIPTMVDSLTNVSLAINPPHRRASVRRAVTKAFSTVNKKKRAITSGEDEYIYDIGHSQLPSCTTSDDGPFNSQPVLQPLRYSATLMANGSWNDNSSPQPPTELSSPNINLALFHQEKHKKQQKSENRPTCPFSPTPKDHTSRSLGEGRRTPTRSNNDTSVHFDRLPAVQSEVLRGGILCVNLVVKPTVDVVTLFSEETIWVVVQIHGQISYPRNTVGGITSLSLPLSEPELKGSDDYCSQTRLCDKIKTINDISDAPPCEHVLSCQKCSTSLGDVIDSCTSAPESGMVRDVMVYFQPRPDGVIKEILGNTSFATLLPGQTSSLMVQVKLRSLAPPLSHRQSHNPETQPVSEMINEAISDLEMSLGEHLSELFDVQVHYNHSLFPDNTRLLAHETCWLRRTLTSPFPKCSQPAEDVDRQGRVNGIESMRRTPSDSPATVVRRRFVVMPDPENEVARKIWQQMRRMSQQHSHTLSEDEEETSKVHIDAHFQEVEKTVRKNQRKMSVDTLISLARDVRHISGDLCDFDRS